MTVFYLFNEQGVCCGTTTDEIYASEWADANEGYYCCDQPLDKLRTNCTNPDPAFCAICLLHFMVDVV